VEHWLETRNDVHLFDQLTAMGIIVDTIEVAAGWNRIGDVYEQVTARLRAEVPELLVVSGHSSHSYPQGTNLYFILAAQPPLEPAEVERVYRSIWERVMETTLACGGTINHHHGIGRLRAPWVPRQLGTAYPLLTALKQALDPKGLMNPGALLPPAGRDQP
jgi:alkyldihydroxyacetonephosphate synthase